MANQAARLRQGRFETKGDIATIGTATILTGLGCSGCLLLTVVGIPFLIVTLPVAGIGVLMLLVIPFLKTKDVKCPKCGEINHILTSRKAFTCKECDTVITFKPDGAPKV